MELNQGNSALDSYFAPSLLKINPENIELALTSLVAVLFCRILIF